VSKIDEISIKVERVNKSFKLPHEKNNSVKGALVSIFRSKRTYEKQQVLKNISFEIKKGEFFGIVGRNGSGKSTLLKLLAGIYSPDSGLIKVNGKLTPFIELGVGFNPELTGRENVFLNGALLGFSRKEMEAMYDEIVEFAELGNFMDQKLKNYSSGMQVRLAFSIAIRAQSDILLLDEVLAVGDEVFQKKCFMYFSSLKRDKKTVILVSHDMESIKRFCTRALFISKGEVRKIASPKVVAENYIQENESTIVTGKVSKNETSKKGVNTSLIKITCNQQTAQNCTVSGGEDLHFKAQIMAPISRSVKNGVVGLTIEDENGRPLFHTTSDEFDEIDLNPKKVVSIELTVQNVFPEGKYFVAIALVSRDRSITYARADSALTVHINRSGRHNWLFYPSCTLKVGVDEY
jgi:ABC-2 type transport system ATP-binding protein